MGHAKSVSWSWSRQNLLKRCPRQSYYSYFPWGEPDQDVYVFLRRARTIPLLIGDVAHYFIALSLKHYRQNGRDICDVIPHAIRRYDEMLKWSESLAERVNQGKRPGDNGSVLMHHLDNGPSELMESAGREAMVECIENFRNSEALRFLKSTDRRKWLPITGEADEIPHIVASPELGFDKSVTDLQVYTPYDVALCHEGTWYIIDWKTGKKSGLKVDEGIQQLAAYSLLLPVKDDEKVAVQPFFLIQDEKWAPTTVTRDMMDASRRAIEEHYRKETAMLTTIEIPCGNRSRTVWHANIDDFPARPKKSFCAHCNFRSVCDEGTAILEQ